MSFSQSTSLPIRVSSAKLDKKDATTSLSMSPINMRNIKGPRTDPCGTPDITSCADDFAEFTTTCCVRWLRKQYIQSARHPDIPRDLILAMAMLISTLSKALAKST